MLSMLWSWRLLVNQVLGVGHSDTCLAMLSRSSIVAWTLPIPSFGFLAFWRFSMILFA